MDNPYRANDVFSSSDTEVKVAKIRETEETKRVALKLKADVRSQRIAAYGEMPYWVGGILGVGSLIVCSVLGITYIIYLEELHTPKDACKETVDIINTNNPPVRCGPNSHLELTTMAGDRIRAHCKCGAPSPSSSTTQP